MNRLKETMDTLTWARIYVGEEEEKTLEKEYECIEKTNEIILKFKGLEEFIDTTKNKALGKEEFCYTLMQEIVKIVEKE